MMNKRPLISTNPEVHAMSLIKNKKKIFVALFLFLLCALYLCGCTTDYDQEDIADYVREKYGLQNFSVSRSPKEVTDEEGYTDYIWTIKLEENPDFRFRVKDDYGWGMESVSNYLHDDYADVALSFLYNQYNVPTSFTLSKDIRSDMVNSAVTGSFQNRRELQQLFTDFEQFANYVYQANENIGIAVDFQMENPLRDRCEYIVDDGDCHSTFYLVTDEDYENALREYLLTCLDYRFEEQLTEFTDEEIQNALIDYEQRIGISETGSEDGPFTFYDDLCASKYYYGVSFGTLYEILRREGFEVTGDCWHYSFTGTDGSLYEISYDFCDFPFDDDAGGTRNGYYYLKDSEQVPMSSYFYNHFSENQIREMTGLVLELTSCP